MNTPDSDAGGANVELSRLTMINQMILAIIFGIGLLLVIFALLFLPTKPDAQILTVVGTLLTTLATVVVMQNTHFFKSGNDTPTVPTTSVTHVYNVPTQTPTNGVPVNVQIQPSTARPDAPTTG